MAQENIIIDLTDEALGSDTHVESGSLSGTTLSLLLTDNSIVDIELIGLTEGDLDKHISSGSFDGGTRQLMLSYNDGSPDITVDMQELADAYLERGGRNWAPSTSYLAGDVVTGPGGRMFIATRDGLLTDPTLEDGNWFEFKADIPHGYKTETGLASFVPDVSQTDAFEYILSQDAVIENMVNAEPGKSGSLIVAQDAIGGWTLGWGTQYASGGNDEPFFDPTPGSAMMFQYYISGAGVIVLDFVLSYNLISQDSGPNMLGLV